MSDSRNLKALMRIKGVHTAMGILLGLTLVQGGFSDARGAPVGPPGETGKVRVQQSVRTSEVVPDQYIVVLRGDVVNALTVANEIALANRFAPRHIYSAALKGFAAKIPKEAMRFLQADSRVAYIEQDRVVRAIAQTLPTGVDRVDADQNATADIDGQDDVRVDVDIAIVDTGIDLDHPDLNVVEGTNCIGSGAPNDGHGHGSHVAGTAAAIDNGSQVVGVAPGARVWAVKVLDDSGSGTNSSVICGIDFVTANAHKIEVANMSLGGGGHSQAMQDAIRNSVNAGVFYAVAAGNDGADIYGSDGQQGTGDDFAPAAFPEVAAVSALADFDGQTGGSGGTVFEFDCFFAGRDFNQTDDTLACFSNYSGSVVADNPVISPGRAIDVAAPGYDIFSTSNNGGTATLSGTSMASPHVAGAAALHIAENGRASDAAGVAAIRQALIDRGQPQVDWRSGDTFDPDGNQEPMAFVPGGVPPSPTPNISINDVSVDEGDAGTTDAVFTVSLSASSDQDVTIDFATADDSATTADNDYVARSGSLAFPAGTTSQTITVTVNGDDIDEPDENFFVNLSNATGANIADSRGEGTIVNDDAPPIATMHVENIVISSQNLFGRFIVRGRTEVQIVDESGTPVSNAAVTGDWSLNGSVFDSGDTGTTGSNGAAVITSGIIFLPSSGDVVKFCVTKVTNSLTYESADNVETCDQTTVQ